ncbi:MAG: UPF0179 family protein [Candidatus Bathyarchaeota archaeon]|nr:UPF0179 family protein [Candidatus Bathyarchaeota archaeon]
MRFPSLCGIAEANSGYTFRFIGIPNVCHECGYRDTCFGRLKPGRLYRVVSVRGKRFPCRLHGEAVLVELEEASIESAVTVKQAIRDAVVTIRLEGCGEKLCPAFDLCYAEGLEDGAKYKVAEVYGERFPCRYYGFKVKVLLKPI